MLLDLIYDRGISKGVSVMLEVDGLGSVAEQVYFPSSIVIAFLEGAQGGSCLSSKAELGANLRPVDLRRSGALGGCQQWMCLN